MFGFLKKKLKESIDKVSSVLKTKEREEEAEEHLAEKIPESVQVPVEPQLEPEVKVEEEVVGEPVETEIPKEVKKEIEKEVRVEAKEHEKEKKPGIFSRIKKAITEKKVEEKDIVPVLSDIQTVLLESDVALEVSEKIVNDLKQNLVGQSVPRGKVEDVVRDSLRKSVTEILNQNPVDMEKMMKEKKPLKIVFLGFNGTGKTTTVARLGHLLKEKGHAPIFAAGDTWRAAAQEQIEIHGKKLGIDVVKHKYGADPAAVIFDAIKAAESRKADVVLADTAGRAHSNTNLMEEMKKIVRVNKPDLKILIVDSLTGNDAVEQARLFDRAVGVDGIIMTKADVYEKGGAVLSTAWAIKRPILYIGVGQGYGDLEKFDVEKIVKNLLG